MSKISKCWNCVFHFQPIFEKPFFNEWQALVRWSLVRLSLKFRVWTGFSKIGWKGKTQFQHFEISTFFMRLQINGIAPIPEMWPSILNREFWIQFSIAKANREKLVKLIKMGKISEILLNSLFISSAYANNFAVPSCNDDTQVSFWVIWCKWEGLTGRDPSWCEIF